MVSTVLTVSGILRMLASRTRLAVALAAVVAAAAIVARSVTVNGAHIRSLALSHRPAGCSGNAGVDLRQAGMVAR